MEPVPSFAKPHRRLDLLKSSKSAHAVDPIGLEELSGALQQLRLVGEEIGRQNAELTAAREALDAERLRYQELFELAPDPYLQTDTHGLISEANRAAGALLGVEPTVLLGKPLQAFIPREERFDFRARVREIRELDGAVEWRLRVRPREGSPLPVAAAVATIRGRQGEITGLRWSIRDITDRVLEEEQLRDEFLTTLSHELRTPLNVVLGSIFRLRSGTLDAVQHQKALETIERNAREQSRLVEDLLDTARITNGRLQLDMQFRELGPIVQGAVDALEARAEARGIRIETTLRQGVSLRCDPERVRQIAWNLLANALKFTPEGGTVRVETVIDPDRASIVVSDSGIGIGPDVMPHIFERFWQAERSTSRSQGGLGLGLAIVKHLVEMHGGEVEAFSPGRGEGATFKVHLPRAGHGSSVFSNPSA